MRNRRHIGNTAIPYDLLRDGIEFEDDPEVKDLERRWKRWLHFKVIIDADWKKDAERRLTEVTTEIETERLLTKLEEERIADQTADDAQVKAYLEQFAAIAKKRNNAWLVEAKKRLDRETGKINKDIARRERKLFSVGNRSIK